MAVFLLGFTGLFGKWVTLPSEQLVLGRVFFASIALFIALQFLRRPIRLENKQHYVVLAVLGAVFAIHWIAFYASIQTSTVAIGVLTFATFPIFVTFLEALVLRRPIAVRDVVVSLIAFAGVTLSVPNPLNFGPFAQGALLGLLSALTFGIVVVFNKASASKIPSLSILFYETLFATVFLLPQLLNRSVTWNLWTLGQLAVLGVVCTALAYVLLVSSMKQLSAHTVSIVGSLEPVYGITLAFFLIHEIPTPQTVLGGVLILSAA
ncbi:MAG TPA: EamA family transporter, partial [Candidatus Norongarragalinales archaeon]|nr:EamA family transporter [Candidatus Norongarragalinales archaeon]